MCIHDLLHSDWNVAAAAAAAVAVAAGPGAGSDSRADSELLQRDNREKTKEGQKQERLQRSPKLSLYSFLKNYNSIIEENQPEPGWMLACF